MALDVQKLKDIDEVLKSRILGQGNLPEVEAENLRQQRVDLSKTLYTDFFKKNVPAQQESVHNKKADFKGNKYTPKDPKSTDMIESLYNRVKENADFLLKNPKFVLDQFILHLLDIGERAIYNPLALPASQIPFIGGGNINTSISVGRLVDINIYRQRRDELKKTYNDVYGGLFGKANKSLYKNGQPNLFTPEKPYSSTERPTFSENGKDVQINFRQFGVEETFGVKRIAKDADGNMKITYDLEQYISDLNDRNRFLYNNAYKDIKYTPANPKTDDFKAEYNRLAKLLFLESNIKKGPEPEEGSESLVLTNDRKIFLYCGVEEKFSESYSVNWNDSIFVGSSQSVHTYSSTTRSFTLNLILYADIEDITQSSNGDYEPVSDLATYKNKINWIRQHCYPEYQNSFIKKSPYIYVTYGNLIQRLPCIIQSLDIEWNEPWSVAAGFVIPMLAKVKLGLTVVHPRSPDINYDFDA